MRRIVPFLLLALLLAGLTFGALASGDGPDQGAAAPSSDRVVKVVQRADATPRRAGAHGMVKRAVLRSLAGRLDVSAAQLRRAGRTVGKAAFRRAKARGLRTLPSGAVLAAEKERLAAGLAQELGKEPDAVLAAVRAELEQRLGQAAALGFLTAKGRDLALACFDAPASCDLRALKAEVRFRHHGGAKTRGAAAPRFS